MIFCRIAVLMVGFETVQKGLTAGTSKVIEYPILDVVS